MTIDRLFLILRDRLDYRHFAFAGNIDELTGFEILQSLASCIELLIELDALLLHTLVRILRTAVQVKILPSGDSYLAITIVQAQAQQLR